VGVEFGGGNMMVHGWCPTRKYSNPQTT